MTLRERAENAVVAKLELALTQLQSELDEVGIEGIDLLSIKDQLMVLAHDQFSEKDADEEGEVLFELGLEGDSAPMPLARSFACAFLRKWMSALNDSMKALEAAEDAKLSAWTKRKFGTSAKFDFNNLRVVAADESSEVAEIMSTIYQVLNYETKRLQGIVAGISHDAEGMAAFVRDLGNARLNDERVGQVLNNLLDVTDPKLIDEVVNSAEMKTSSKHKAIVFMGKILKKSLVLELKDEDWRFLGDEDDGEAAA